MPRYRIVDDDRGDTVQMYELADGADRAEREPRSLAWPLKGPVPDLG